MTLTTMFAGYVNSPNTTLSAGISNTDTTIPVTELGVFPTAPNLAVIGTGEYAETIYYGAKSAASGAGNLTSVTREYDKTGAYGAKSLWASGTVISRLFTKHDLTAVQTNVTDLQTKPIVLYAIGAIIPVTSPATVDQVELTNGLNYVYGGYSYTALNALQWMMAIPPELSSSTFTISVEWITTSSSLNTVYWDIYGVRTGDGASRNVGLLAKNLITIVGNNTGADYTNVSTAGSAVAITGTGNTITIQASRDYTTDTLNAEARLILVRFTPVI